jgi:hypothetical protein
MTFAVIQAEKAANLSLSIAAGVPVLSGLDQRVL